jgi:hypothetical protein
MDCENQSCTSRNGAESGMEMQGVGPGFQRLSTETKTQETSEGWNGQKTENTPPSERKVESAQHFSFQDSPTLDLIALVLSAGVLIAIVSLLRHFDGRKQPNWKHLSLNTVIAWLSTISKGSIVLLTSRSIGQLKWLWFVKREQKVSDLRTFDMASRGMLGSVIFLFKQRGR